MKAAHTCISNGDEISVLRALKLQKENKSGVYFTCISCNEPVKPHKEGNGSPAHFEHYERNANCPHSDGKAEKDESFSIEDKRAIEGYRKDQKILVGVRNQELARQCKVRDKYTCQACRFKLKHNGRYIAECHHKHPIGLDVVRETSLDDLVTLCPTCHRIAHTSKVPLTVEQIALVVKGRKGFR